MKRLKNVEELRNLREVLNRDIKRNRSGKISVLVDTGSVALSLGAGEVLSYFRKKIVNLKLNVEITEVGGIGLDAKEPIIAVISNGEIFYYGNVNIDKANRIIEEHLIRNKVPEDIVIARSVYNG